MEKILLRCAVCNRKLKDNESIDRGVGPICQKHLDHKTLTIVKESVLLGFQPVMIHEGAIELSIPESEAENIKQ
ncbi:MULTISPECIES: DUF6011 domain-containing protein [Alkalibacillus]|uniref:Uncharacterized protein n=1 Tax=Alkalibacillus salilacus TaxID=284582 RepID=A0ABT9VDF6_9BACI|nr:MULTISPECIES: DUF6011 domain-containing protein [Alkalibacillus]MDQ0158992.1 hypothetical protein [Alkalibacillus salilacus]NIK10891.1 hypothetical protein [Alkalibacillus almallahensis]